MDATAVCLLTDFIARVKDSKLKNLESHTSNRQTTMRSALMFGRVLAITGCCLISACASIGIGGSDLDINTAANGSAGGQSPLLAGINPSDWNVMLDKISKFDKATLAGGKPMALWSNPETGTKGQITMVKVHQSLLDEECRSFKSSMHSVTGVENIQGEICRATDGNWQITGFSSGATA